MNRSVRVWALVLASACGDAGLPSLSEPPPISEDVDTEAMERAYVLDDEAYRFCQEAGPYSEDLRAWCAIEDQVDPDRCPGFHELCQRSEAEDVATPLSGGCLGGGPGGPPTRPAGAPTPPEPSRDWTPSSSCDAPDSSLGWLGSVLAWVVAGIIALGVLVVLRMVLWAIAQRRPKEEDDAVDVVALPVIESVSDDEVPDVPSSDLLHSADVALNEGRTTDAILLARAAALRHLGDRGVVRLHRSRTDREYVRSVRRQDAVHGPLATVVGWVERLRWGGANATSDEARAVLSAVRKLVAATAMLALAVLAVGADGAYRYSPYGDAGIADLYERAGYSVTWRLRSLESIDASTDVLLVDLAGIEPSDGDWSSIRAWVRDGGVLIVGGQVEVAFPDVGEPAVAPGVLARSQSGVQVPVFLDSVTPGWSGGAGEAVVWAPIQSVAFVEALYMGDGVVYALAPSSLLWNASLMAEDNEDFLLDLVAREFPDDAQREEVHIQLALVASAGSDNPLETLWKARLLPLLLQVMVLMALAALWLGWPFAPLRDPESSQRQRFTDHIEALGGRYRALGASDWTRRAYARWTLTRYGPAGLISRAERHGKTHDQALAWVDRVRALAEGESTDDTMTLEELWKTTHPT